MHFGLPSYFVIQERRDGGATRLFSSTLNCVSWWNLVVAFRTRLDAFLLSFSGLSAHRFPLRNVRCTDLFAYSNLYRREERGERYINESKIDDVDADLYRRNSLVDRRCTGNYL